MKKKKFNPYKQANEDFLTAKAQEEGMVVLDNGVIYRVLEEGHGTKKPTPRSIVYVHYTGRLIDGTVFDSTQGQPLPALFMVGYGATKMDDIPAHSTLVFVLQLVKIER